MKNCKRAYPIGIKILILMLVLAVASAQAQNTDTFHDARNYIGINPLQLVFGEVQISADRRVTSHLAVGFTVSHKFNTGGGTFNVSKEAPFGNEFLGFDYDRKGGYMPFTSFSSGNYFDLFLKFFFNNNWYLAFAPFYRSYSFKNRMIEYAGSSAFLGPRSEKEMSTGLKFTIGTRRYFSQTFPAYYDLFWGIGTRVKKRQVMLAGESRYSYYGPFTFITPQVGVKVGYSF